MGIIPSYLSPKYASECPPGPQPALISLYPCFSLNRLILYSLLHLNLFLFFTSSQFNLIHLTHLTHPKRLFISFPCTRSPVRHSRGSARTSHSNSQSCSATGGYHRPRLTRGGARSRFAAGNFYPSQNWGFLRAGYL